MADSLTLIVLIAAGGSSGGTEALLQAAHESLGNETHIEVRDTPHEPTDLEALTIERRDHPDAVAELAYRDRKHKVVTLRVHVAKPHRWLERTLVFDPADVEVERARTMGYAMAALLPEPFPHHLEEPKPPPPPEPPAPRPPPPAPAPRAPKEEPRPRPAQAGRRVALELLAVARTGIGGDADAAGGELAAHVYLLPLLSIRLAVGVEGGSIGVVDVSTLTVFGSAGLAFHPLRATPAQPVGISVRADYVLTYDQGVHADDPLQSQSLSGLDLFGEVGLMVVPGIEAVAGLGLEALFPRIVVRAAPIDQETKSATIPTLRLGGEGGVRVSF